MKIRLLFVAVAMLSAFILLRPTVSGFRISQSSPALSKSIRIERRGMPIISISKEGNEWKILSPVRGEARKDAVNGILSVLDAKSERKLQDGDLSRFGLDQPVLRLTIDAEAFDFGILNPVTDQQYVKTKEGVFLVSPKYALMPSLDRMEADHAGTS